MVQDFFFSFPFNTATFGKEHYVSEYGTNRPCLLAFLIYFSLLEQCENQFKSFKIVYKQSNHYL